MNREFVKILNEFVIQISDFLRGTSEFQNRFK